MTDTQQEMDSPPKELFQSAPPPSIITPMEAKYQELRIKLDTTGLALYLDDKTVFIYKMDPTIAVSMILDLYAAVTSRPN